MSPSVVSSTLGAVSGKSTDGIECFLGIPFATSSRFQFSTLIENVGNIEAKEFKGTPLQKVAPWMSAVPEPSEDALFLNIFRKEAPSKKLPVIFWIYGGGFEGGTASTPMFWGKNFVDSGEAILVSANYRVGFVGFGYLPGQIPANIGIGDVITALNWVKRNIEAFGGDPDNVTLMGESAGGFIAASLSAIPQARGLFSRSIMFSGAASRITSLDRVKNLTEKWKAEVETSGTKIEVADATVIVDAQAKVIPTDIGIRNSSKPNALGVTLDTPDGLLVEHPFASLSREGACDVILGVTNAEISLFRKFGGEKFIPQSLQALTDEVESWGASVDQSKNIVDFYKEKSGDDLGKLRELILTDWIYRLPAVRLAFARDNISASTYMFEFANADGSDLGHGEDLKYVFKPYSELSAEEVSIARNVMNNILKFSRGEKLKDYDLLDVIGNKRAELDRMMDIWDGVDRP